MTNQLTTQNATITTAVVEVKTLTIGGKQVTLAVFRQLREEQLLAGDGSLVGEPWGYVNYHPDKCDGDPQHLHVVWQRGPELLRARVNAPWAAALGHPAASAYAEALIAEGLDLGHPTPIEMAIKGSNSMHKPGTVRLTYKGVEFTGTVRPMFAEAYQQGGSGSQMQRLEERMVDDHGMEWGSDFQLEKLPVATYQQAWRVLNELPQLFIAV